MTPAELQAIEERALAATPCAFPVLAEGDTTFPVIVRTAAKADLLVVGTKDGERIPGRNEDALFHANAREDVLALVAALRESARRRSRVYRARQCRPKRGQPANHQWKAPLWRKGKCCASGTPSAKQAPSQAKLA
ncbi:MAG: hypothetical protein AB1705_26220 [Verrucomicrobiota bacterium]